MNFLIASNTNETQYFEHLLSKPLLHWHMQSIVLLTLHFK